MNPSLFETLVEAPADPILGTATAYKADPHPQKVNLGVGAYRTEEGKPYIFPSVQKAQAKLVANKVDKEYLPIDGLPELKKPTQQLIFGSDFSGIQEQRIATVQSLSGTGGLRVAAEFIKSQIPQCQNAYISNPTWGNHRAIFNAAGLKVKEYAYWNAAVRGLDFKQMIDDLRAAPEYSLVVLHACAHNPTGVDPTQEQWKAILEVVKERKLIPLFDSAYQGYASGDLEKDAYSIRLFAQAGLEMFVTQSFAKNAGLYGERIGMLHVLCHSADKAKIVLSQLKPVIRRMYSSPPGWGARIMADILLDAENRKQWETELKAVSARINRVRIQLKDGLVAKGTPGFGDWSHVTNQIGMFSYTGLSPEQCERLTSKWHIYLLKSGRISLAGLCSSNLDYVINAFDETVRHTSSHL